MNFVNVLEPLEDRSAGPSMTTMMPAVDNRGAGRSGNSQVFTLRKSGGRPISFSGRHLGMQNGYRLGTVLWHELNLYQTDDGRSVADIRVFSKAENSKDQFHVHVADSLDDALSFLENYDPRIDVVADFEIDDPTLTPAELMVHAAALKYRVAETVNQYRALLGAFLNDLNGS